MLTWKRTTMVLTAFALASWLSTEVFAYTRGWHPWLGQPLTQVGIWPVYMPFGIWSWAWQWGWKAPGAFRGAAWVFGLVFGGLTVAMLWPRKMEKPQAQWATRRSLLEEQVLASTGVVLGKWKGRTLRYDGDVHTLMVAPSGSQKTTTVGVPTALTSQRSLFMHDPKAELYALSAGWRSTFSRVIHLHPTSADSDCFDPLSAIRLGKSSEMRETTMITGILANPDGERPRSAAEQHFQELTEMILNGVVLHGLYTGDARTLPELDQFFFSEATLENVLKAMEKTAHTVNGPHPAVLRSVRLLKRLADRELSGVQTTTARALQMTTDPVVARMLSSNSFTLQDLRERQRPLSLYLTVPYSDQERLRPLTRMLVRQVLDYSTHRLGGWRHRLLMLIDEVQALNYMPTISAALNFVRGYGVNLVLITPSLNELDRVYGPKNNFVEGCHLRVVFAPNDPDIAEKFSRMTGTSEQTDGQRTWEERLLSTTGLTYLPKEKGLLLIGNGGYPALITKAPYYRNWRLTRRSRREVA